MNTTLLKSYAPRARRDFIGAVTARANLLGLSEAQGVLSVLEAEVKNDIVLIAGRPWPVKVNELRRNLIARMSLIGFCETIEAVAYSWFNRLAALRYMEVHDYLGHGRKVLSNPNGGLPEVLTFALDLAESGVLPGLSGDKVRELKLANQDAELYRLILIAQCNALHQAMPFLFEQLGDETELLLPENLLLTDSVVAKLVQSIPEEDWQQIEIIGWLYQFYISEKKEQVIGKVVKSEDIPAATQLFTPNWIVKYMVQNSLGAQWLATYPDSPLKAQMAYYIEPAEQTEEVNAQLAAITPNSLNPEELTLIDPASGSGHILVEAYDLFKAIYLERGFQPRRVAQLILEKNLFGLDIDERAAQLTGFALMMKARADDRQLFERGVKLNVMALVDSADFDAEGLATGLALANYGLHPGDLNELKRLFEHATTFGSLIQVPEGLKEKLPALKHLSETSTHDLFMSKALKHLGSLVQLAEALAANYDSVVANPPYMGSKGMNVLAKKLAKDYFPDAKSDLFACFIERGLIFAKRNGHNAMVTMQSWMFLSSLEKMRRRILENNSIKCLAHFPYENRTPTAMGINFGISVFSIVRRAPVGPSHFCCARAHELDSTGVPLVFPPRNERLGYIDSRTFTLIPGCPISYWITPALRSSFKIGKQLGVDFPARTGMTTGDDERFLRQWHEVPSTSLNVHALSSLDAEGSGCRWFPYNKGGIGERWYGHCGIVINWKDDGAEIKRWVVNNPKDPNTTSWSRRVFNSDFFFKSGATWTLLNSRTFNVRLLEPGSILNVNGPTISIESSADRSFVVGFLNSKVARVLVQVINPTAANNPGDIGKLPFLPRDRARSISAIDSLIGASRSSWTAYERSWDFRSLPYLTASSEPKSTLDSSYTNWITQNRETIAEVKQLEEENNYLFIDAYGLQDELTPDVPIEQITLTVNPAYRYGGKLTEDELWTRFRQDTMSELVSYAIGCMMGRYSLDAPGLIYANSGNVGFDASRYTKFSADADGIVPITDELWFEDDAAQRLREFLLAVWDKDSLEQNMDFLADNLGRKASESPEQAIRRYLADNFFKDHLQTYKKRPIYWLFSSGKQGAFKALVYLHRYNAGTLSRLRAEYVVPLTGKMQGKIELLESDIETSNSTAQRNKLSKQRDKLRKQHLELLAYDEQLRHYADQRIELDLDDGVKVNYAKFGDLLAEVNPITGGKDDES